jgi:hypothetical protein
LDSGVLAPVARVPVSVFGRDLGNQFAFAAWAGPSDGSRDFPIRTGIGEGGHVDLERSRLPNVVLSNGVMVTVEDQVNSV